MLEAKNIKEEMSLKKYSSFFYFRTRSVIFWIYVREIALLSLFMMDRKAEDTEAIADTQSIWWSEPMHLSHEQ